MLTIIDSISEGNDDLHEITTYSPHELRVDLRDFEGSRTYAKYSTFSVGNETSDYVVSISGFSGNVESRFILYFLHKLLTISYNLAN